MSRVSQVRELTLSLLRLSDTLDYRCFNRDTCTQYAIQRDKRLGSCDQDLGEGSRLLVVCKGSARK